MIGYNVQKAQELMDQIAATYNKMASTIGGNWISLEAIMKKEWVGPDEVAMQNEIAGRLIQLHKDCHVTVKQVVKNICEIERGWRDFQGRNKVSGGKYGVEIDKIKQLEPPSINDSEIEQFVKTNVSLDFAEGINLGLTNGESSAANIKSQAQEFSTSVHSYVSKMYNELDASNAFLGGSQATEIDKYLSNIGEGLGRFLSSFKDLYDALDVLAKQNYTDSASQVGTDLNQSSIEIDSSNSIYNQQ